MAGNTRTVLSTKRARDRRQRALRRADKKNGSTTSATDATDAALTGATLEPLLPRKASMYVERVRAVDLKLDEPVSSGEEGTRCSSSSSSSSDGNCDADGAQTNQLDSSSDSDDNDSDDDDNELVIVERVADTAFCTQFVPLAQLVSVAPPFSPSYASLRPTRMGSKRCREFSVTVPRFRETPEGFTCYTIAIETHVSSSSAASSTSSRLQRFELERRFSEFVALATALQRIHAGSSHLPVPAVASSTDDNNNNGDSSDSAIHWELPPRTWFRVTQPLALEARRQQLEQSLLQLLSMKSGTMSRRPLVRAFLQLDVFAAHVADNQDSDDKSTAS